MFKIFSLLIATLCFTALAYSQPIVNHFLAIPNDVSHGGTFSSIIETSEVLIKGYQPIPHKTEKKFNGNGLITEQIAYNSAGGKSSETHWEYTPHNGLSKKYHKFFANLSGWNEEEVIVEWDNETLIPLKVEVLKNGKMSQWALMTMDTLGRIESAKVFGPTGAHIFTEKFIYVEPSNMIKVMVYKSNGLYTSSWSYPLNPEKEFRLETIACQRYPNGDVMLEKLSSALKGDQAYYYEYEYDSQGNWIEKRTYQVELGKNDKIKKKSLENRVTRKITY